MGSGSEPTSTGAGVEPPDTDITGEVTWVSDGDTIDVDTDQGTVTVRLVAINAPDQGECYSEDGLDHLIETLKGEQVGLEVMGEDQFDRVLAHVFVGTRHINLEMVEDGFAIASSPGEDDPHRDEILAAEDGAFQGRFGLWSRTACGHDGPIPEVNIASELSVVDPPGHDDDVLDMETVQVVNNGTYEVDLDGWILRDESTRHRFVFGAGTPLAFRATVEVASDDTGWDPGGSSVWNNSGDMALLQLPDGTVVDRWRYP